MTGGLGWNRNSVQLILLFLSSLYGSSCQNTVTVEITVPIVFPSTATSEVPSITPTPDDSVQFDGFWEKFPGEEKISELSVGVATPTANVTLDANSNNSTAADAPAPQLATVSYIGLAIMGVVFLIFITAGFLAWRSKRRGPRAEPSKARDEFFKSSGNKGDVEKGNGRGLPEDDIKGPQDSRPLMNIEVTSNPHLRPADRKSILPDYMRPKNVRQQQGGAQKSKKPVLTLERPPMPKFEIKTGNLVYDDTLEEKKDKFVIKKIETEHSGQPPRGQQRPAETRSQGPSFTQQPRQGQRPQLREAEPEPASATTFASSPDSYTSSPRTPHSFSNRRDSYDSDDSHTLRSPSRATARTNGSERTATKADRYEHSRSRSPSPGARSYAGSEWSYESNASKKTMIKQTANNVPNTVYIPASALPPTIIISGATVRKPNHVKNQPSHSSMREKHQSPPPPPPPPKDWQASHTHQRSGSQPGITAAAVAKNSVSHHQTPTTPAYQTPQGTPRGNSGQKSGSGLPNNPRPRKERSKENYWDLDIEKGQDSRSARGGHKKNNGSRDLLNQYDNPSLYRY